MSALILRQQAAQATIDRFQGKPLQLGKNDCARMAVFCLRQLGVKFSLLKIGPYKTEIGAAKVLRDLGFASITEAVDALGLPRIAPAMCLPGDIMTLKAVGSDDVALAVAVGNGRVLGFWETAGVCAVFQPVEYGTAWRSI
jgi:hypothetical protein